MLDQFGRPVEARAGPREAREALLVWEGITVRTTAAGEAARTVLSGVSGVARSGEVLAVMGPSGAGKTTLLELLAGRGVAKGLEVGEGEMRYGGERRPEERLRTESSFVFQEDLLVPTVTARETLVFAARLQRASLSREEQNRLVDEVLEELELTSAQDTLVGNTLRRGLSGGEKKRVAIAVQLLASPRLLFLDEPTSGLDSSTAEVVIGAVRRAARRRNFGVICTIHQPDSGLFARCFDKLLLLSRGRAVYSGPIAGVKEYFAGVGCEMPLTANPADAMIDFVVEKEGSDASRLADEFAKSELGVQAADEAAGSEKALAPVVRDTASFGAALGVLFERAFKGGIRNPAMFVSMGAGSVLFALLFGIIFYDLPVDDATTQSYRDRLNALFFLSLCLTFFPAFSLVAVFPPERPIYQREMEAGLYSKSALVLALLVHVWPVLVPATLIALGIFHGMVGLQNSRFGYLVGITFLSQELVLTFGLLTSFASGGSIQIANLVFNLVIIVGFLFCSNFVDPPIARGLRWLRALTFYVYICDAYFVNEFTGLALGCGDPEPCPVQDGAQYVVQTPAGDAAVVALADIPCTLNCLFTDGAEYVAQYVELELWELVAVMAGFSVAFKIILFWF